MAVDVNPLPLSALESKSNISIPSYQRRSDRWDSRKKFNLALSIFSGYPIGSVVFYKYTDGEDTMFSLMDGQQRYAAIKKIFGPRDVGFWAKEMGFDHDDASGWLKKHIISKSPNPKKKNVWEAAEEEDSEFYPTDPLDMKPGLTALLQLIQGLGKVITRRVHEHSTKFFEFEHNLMITKYFETENQPFKSQAGEVDFAEIHRALKEFPKHADLQGNWDSKTFADYWLHRGGGTIKSTGRISKDQYTERWENDIDLIYDNKIKPMITTIHNYFTIAREHKVAEIVFSEEENYEIKPEDLSAVFRIINDSGVPLEDVEIFAASPLWTAGDALITPDADLVARMANSIEEVRKSPTQDLSKWQYCALFKFMIDEMKEGDDPLFDWIFKESPKTPAKIVDSFTAGFILFSVMTEGSAYKGVWGSGYNHTVPDGWGSDQFFKDLEGMGRCLFEDNYFKKFRNWDHSFESLTGAYASRALFACLYNLWIHYEKPPHHGRFTGKKKKFIRSARKLIDKIVYESVKGKWVGGADSYLPNFITDLNLDDVGMVEVDQWSELLEEMIEDGTINGEDYTRRSKDPSDANYKAIVRVLLIHMYSMRKIEPSGDWAKIHVDHITPRAKWTDYWESLAGLDQQEENQAHNIVNLSLMGEKENIKKGDKVLTDPGVLGIGWIKAMVIKYTDIPEASFADYDTVDTNTITKLKGHRKDRILTTFSDSRQKLFRDNDWTP